MERDYLHDENFLLALNEVRVKKTYVKIIMLDFQENPIKEIQGQSLDGNITINGSSAARRTINLTMSAQRDETDLDNVDNLISINKKIKIELGTNNPLASYSYYGDVVWFPLGVYIITNASVSYSTRNINIQITGRDKMCMLDGTCGGALPASVVFHEIGNDYIEGQKEPTIAQIIFECVHHFGGELTQNIIILDLDETAKLGIKYNGTNPIWFPERYGGFIISEDAPTQYPAFLAHKFIYGQDIGYKETPFTYPNELIKGAGDTITSVLDEILKVLGNYEYFYNLEGKFIFQEKKNYLNHYYTPITEINADYYVQAFSDNKYYFSLTNDSTVKTYRFNPKYDKIKNDFSIWGSRKNKNGQLTAIQYHLAVDEKPMIDLAAQYMGEIKTRGNEHLYYFFNVPDRDFASREERDEYEKNLLAYYEKLSPDIENGKAYDFSYNDIAIQELVDQIDSLKERLPKKDSKANDDSAQDEEDISEIEEKISELEKQLNEYKIAIQDTPPSSSYKPLQIIKDYIVEELSSYQFDIPYIIYCKITYNLTDYIFYKVTVQQGQIIQSEIIAENRNEITEITKDSRVKTSIGEAQKNLTATGKKILDLKEDKKEDESQKPQPISDNTEKDKAEENQPENNKGDENNNEKPEEKAPELLDADLHYLYSTYILLDQQIKYHFLTKEVDEKIKKYQAENKEFHMSFVNSFKALNKDNGNVVNNSQQLYIEYIQKVESNNSSIKNLLQNEKSYKIDPKKFESLYGIDYEKNWQTEKSLFDCFQDINKEKEESINKWLAFLKKDNLSLKEQQKLLIGYIDFLQSMLDKESQILVDRGEDKIVNTLEKIPKDPVELFIYNDNCVFEFIGRPCHEWREELFRQALLTKEAGLPPAYYDPELLLEVVDKEALAKQNELLKKTNVNELTEQDQKTPMMYRWRTMFDTLNTAWENEWEASFFDKQHEEWDGWNPIIYTDPSILTYWLDFIDNEALLNKYSVRQIGRRTYSKTDDSLHYLYTLAIPDVIFFENDGNMAEIQEKIQEYLKIGQLYCAYKPIHKDYFKESATGMTIFDYLRELIYQYLVYQSTITITCSPKYYLKPNQLIYIKDTAANLVGDYGIVSMTIPLKFDGVMTINATEALLRV